MISIIVPVYNIERYVSYAINSILTQSDPDWEVILVDDGSMDGSVTICDNYSLKDSRIRTIHKKNGGLSSARNEGIRAARGDYVMFLDGDDYLHHDTLKVLNETALQNPELDFIQFYYKEVEGYINSEGPVEIKNLEIVTSEAEMFARLYDLGGIGASSCTKLYQRSVFHHVMFTEGILHEDEDFATRLIAHTSRAGYCSCEFYYYVTRQGSIIHTRFTSQKMNALKVVSDRINYLQSKGYDELVRKNESRLATMCVELYQLAHTSGHQKEQMQIQECFRALDYVANPYIQKRVKCLGIMSKWIDSLKWYDLVYRIVKPMVTKCKNAKTKVRTLYECRKRRRQIKYKDFTIISNNCWGGIVYKHFGLPYLSPTVGLFIMDDDYIKFLERFDHYILQPLRFIESSASRYYAYLSQESTFKGDYPIALLDDIEIHFLHYHSQEEATIKWSRRCQRINRKRMLVKMSQRYVHSKEILDQFADLPFPNKICFTEIDYDKQGFIKIEELKKLNIQGGDETPFVMQKVNLLELINNIK